MGTSARIPPSLRADSLTVRKRGVHVREKRLFLQLLRSKIAGINGCDTFTILHNDINGSHDTLMTQCQFPILIRDFRTVSSRKLLGDAHCALTMTSFFLSRLTLLSLTLSLCAAVTSYIVL